jgi:hypothetical protein
MKSFAAATLAVSAGAVSFNHSAPVWCAAPPVDLTSFNFTATQAGAEFRGGFRDFSLYVEDRHDTVPHCETLENFHDGNDGLWIVEFQTEEQVQTERARATELGLRVVAQRKLSLLISGGEEVTGKLGYDACGTETDKVVLSVPTARVAGPHRMAAADKARYLKVGGSVAVRH